MECTQCKNILRNYFNNIVYIDDQFDTSLVDEHANRVTFDDMQAPPMDIPNDSTPIVGDVGVYTESVEIDLDESMKTSSSYIQLSELLIKLNEKPYQDIQLTPILYKNEITEELVIKNMIKAPLSIIDWELSTKIKAFSLIKKMLDNTDQLKVIVVYTRSYSEAYAALTAEYEEKEYIEWYNSPENSLTIVQVKNKSLIVIAAKQLYNILELQDIVINNFISLHGTIPIALLELTQKINEKSGRLFGSFCHPLDQLYFLQMYYSDADKYEMKENLSGFIVNKIKSDVELSDEFINEILFNMKNRLGNLLHNEDFESLKNRMAELICHRVPTKYEKYCEAIKSIPKDDFIACITEAIKPEKNNWQSVVDSFDCIVTKIRTDIVEIEYDKLYDDKETTKKADYEKTFANHIKKLKDSIKYSENNTYVEFKKQVWPLFLQLLGASDDLLNMGIALVSNLKYHKYSNDCLKDFLNVEAGISKKKLSEALFNKFHFGDVLYKEQDVFMLCITPSCDTYRLEKTNFNINFIIGKKISEDDLQKNQKVSHHVSAYPLENGNNEIIYIEWHFYEQTCFDLQKKEDRDKLSEYTRTYRMDELYMRQIANKYISYYSRAGVNELFLKEKNAILGVF